MDATFQPETFRTELTKYANYFVQSQQDAEDVVQDVLILAYAKPERYTAKVHLFAKCKQRAIDYLNARKRRNNTSIDAMAEYGTEPTDTRTQRVYDAITEVAI